MFTVTTLDGQGFSRFVAAGTYFLKKYREVLNDLNVFPVPDGDTGSNLYLTVKAALLEAIRVRDRPLNVVAAAAAGGALLGARGNSGVIFSQMLRGFAHSVRHREHIDTFELAVAMKDAVAAARAALLHPVEGTILSVANAAAEEAYHLAPHETEFYRVGAAIVRAAHEALERTPEQLPQLREAGVVDAGGAGLVYFLEGILRFLPAQTQRATAYPRRAIRSSIHKQRREIGENKFCTEFILSNAAIEPSELRDLLSRKGDSLLVAGECPVLRVHVHTAEPSEVQSLAAHHGTVERVKVDDMSQQHRLLVVDAPKRAFSIVAIVPGLGFDRIARELGAEETIVTEAGANPSVGDIVLGIRKCIARDVIVLPNDSNIVLAAREAGRLLQEEKNVTIVASRDAPAGLAVLVSVGGRTSDGPTPNTDELETAAARVRTASVFFSGKSTTIAGLRLGKGAPMGQIGGVLFSGDNIAAVVEEAMRRLAGTEEGLMTLYYGGAQRERDAERLASLFRERLPSLDIEWFFGGQQTSEYVVSFER